MKKKLALVLALAMSLSLLSSCGNGSQDETSTSSAPEESTAVTESGTAAESPAADSSAETYDSVTIGSTASHFVGHFDIAGVLSDNFCMPAAYLVYDKLLYNTNEGYDSYILSEFTWDETLGDYGGTILTLKDGITFANGDQMTAEDIVYSMRHHSQASRAAGNWAMVNLDAAEFSEDGLTVSIPWNQTYGGWELIYADVCIYDEEYIEANGGENYDWADYTLLNGSGPYKCTESNGETMMVFEKRSDWWEEGEGLNEATVNKITLCFYTDSTSMMVDYENGAIDAVLNISAEDYDYVAADSALGTAASVSANAILTVVMDVDNSAALQDENLRKAICYAIDKESVGVLAYGSLYSVAEGFLASTNEYFVDGYTYDYDPELAKQLIEDNNLTGTTLKWVVPSGTNATVAEAIQAQLGEVGITVDLQIYDAATCIQMWLEEGNTDFILDSASNANTSNFANNQWVNLRAGTDFSALRKVDENWNTMLDTALNSTDQAEKADLYAQVQEYEYNNYFAVPICEWYSAYAYGASGVIADMALVDVSNPNLRLITTSAVQ